jgi:hypothetical protein
MMKFVKILTAAIFTVIVFAAGVWFFAPWESGGLFVFDKLRLAADAKGCYMNYSGFESRGILLPEYRVRSIDIETAFSRTSISNLRIKLLPLSSILSGSPACYIEFGRGDTTLITNSKLSHERGRFWIAVSRGRLKISGAQLSGDVRISGGLDYDRSGGALSENTLLIRVPENIDSMMKNPIGAQYVGRYIESVNSGEWRIKQNAAPN